MLNVSVQGVDLVIRQLSTIKSPTVRRRIFMQAARQLIKSSKARVSSQTDLDGQAFAPHAKGRKRKMLARLIRRLAYTMTDAGAEVGWKNSFEGGIAYKQQFGFKTRFTKSQFKDKKPLNHSDPATRQQAKALIEAGYKVRSKGKSLKTPTLKWITQNLSMGQAGLLLRVLRGAKTEWTTTLPPRSFLGVTAEDLKTLSALINTELQNAFNGVVSA
jgi:phage virion morphogenesis protein